MPDALDATLQHVSCHLPDALDAALQPAVSFCFYVQVSPWAENVFRSVMSKWNLRVKRANADTRRMARSALTRNRQPWNSISQRNCVLRRPMDCWMKNCRVCVQFCLAIQYTWKAPAQRLRKVSAQDLDCLSCSPCRMSYVYTLVTKHSSFFCVYIGIQIHD